MKKEYDIYASKRNIKNLELYTKLGGFFFVSVGINFLLIFIYCEYVMTFEDSKIMLLFSVVMFVLAPIVMTDPRKANRDLFATVGYGLMHSFCTILGILVTHFYLLFIVYGVELILVIILVVRNKKNNSRRKKQKRT